MTDVAQGWDKRERTLMVCARCGAERTDYEGPNQHLERCPNCGFATQVVEWTGVTLHMPLSDKHFARFDAEGRLTDADVNAGQASDDVLDEIADLRRRLNAALEDSSIAEAGRLEALRERDGYRAALERIDKGHGRGDVCPQAVIARAALTGGEA